MPSQEAKKSAKPAPGTKALGRITRLKLQCTKAPALVSGMALADAALKAERDPIRAQATTLVEAKGATARGKAKAAKRATPS